MALGFTKSFFDKQISGQKQSNISESQIFHGITGEKRYVEKVSDRGISFHQMHMMYVANVWVRACIDKIVERMVDIEPIVKPLKINLDGDDKTYGQLSDSTKSQMERAEKFLTEPNENYESLIEIRKKWAFDILKYDAGAIEIVKGLDIKKGEKFAQIFNVPGNTVKINIDNKGILDKKDAYVQVDEGLKKVASWSPEKLIYFMNNPHTNKIYGVSPLETLVQTVTAELYASQFNLDFFYNNATPRFAVLMEGLGIGQGASALKRVRKWWDEELQGKPHRPIIMGTEQGKVTLQKVGMSNEEMQFQQYSAYLLTKIMAIYKLQPIILGIVGLTNVGSGGGATSNVEEQMRQFKLDAIQPLLKLFWQKINQRVIFSKDYMNMNEVYVDYDLDLVDKKSQAEWHDKYLQDGVITINEIRTTGLGLRPVPWGNVPYMQNNISPFGVGPNGQAVPGNPDEANASAAGNNGSRSNVATITNSTTKTDLKKYLEKDNGNPVGWEDMPVSERLGIIEQLIKEREKFLVKTYMIPEDKVLK